ncbi:MAG: DUF3276 family protein [Cyclobacteriaceae bacterium]
MEENKDNDRQEIYSERVRAGKRTYFFDIKATRSNDYYLTITESKRRYKDGEDGFFYEKHKIFLYKEDFNKFVEALNNTVGHVKTELLPEVDFTEFDREKDYQEKESVSADASDSSDDTELKWD